MTAGTMLDTNVPVTTTYLRSVNVAGLVAVSRPLFGGATDANGNVPQPVATPVTAGEVAAIHAAGLAFLPYANNYGYGDLLGDAAVAQRKVAEIVAACEALGMPAGCYFAHDFETWSTSEAFFDAVLAATGASQYAGVGVCYGSLGVPGDGSWRDTLTAMQRAGNAHANRAVQWLAAYGNNDLSGYVVNGEILLPALPNWAGASTFGWQALGSVEVGALAVDLSVLRLPVLAVGSEGLWLADGSVGSPK